MNLRLNLPWLLLGTSVLVVAGLIGWMRWTETAREGVKKAPLKMYCAAGIRLPAEELAKAYEEETGQRVEITFGGSEIILTQLERGKQGDLFLPGDESYIADAAKKELLQDILPVARMKAVVLLSPKLTTPLTSWNHLVAPGIRIGQADAKSAAIGKLTKEHLSATQWDALMSRTIVTMGTVNEVANAVKLGTVDAGLVWDAVARGEQYQNLKLVELPELDAVQANVQIAVTKFTEQYADAVQFARFVTAREPGLRVFREHGFDVREQEPKAPAKAVIPTKRDPSDDPPEIVLYAGTMLRPAIEQTIKDFEQREGVRVTRVYNGCGILVSQMKVGAQPDAYFACDTMFMEQVADRFRPSRNISKNRLVIAVPKGNPNGIRSLKDLAKEGLRIGVGHEQQCALGVLTKGVFLQNRIYKAVMANVKVQSPAGDLLISQLRAKSLDAVVAYKSNVTPFEEEIEGIELEDIQCSPTQPIAVGKDSKHADLVERLILAIESAESRERFEKLGFGWENKK